MSDPEKNTLNRQILPERKFYLESILDPKRGPSRSPKVSHFFGYYLRNGLTKKHWKKFLSANRENHADQLRFNNLL